MKPSKRLLAMIMLLVTASLYVAIFGVGKEIKGVREMRFGIDIRGGVEAVFEPKGLDREATPEELETAREVLEMRLDNQNITDREVTIDKEGGYIIVRFPWKSNEVDFQPEDAIAELGNMAQLTFQDSNGNVMLEGKNVKSSSVTTDESSGTREYVVQLIFDDEGAQIFEKVTGQLLGQYMGIYMDGVRISNPQVETQISGGQAIINGMSNYEEAKKLSDQINAGALPFSLQTTSFSTISPTLGSHALSIMLIAGAAAFVLVCIFMIVVYKLPGIIACITMLFQMTLQLLAVSAPQYTLTLPGIAGIILSLGMAVDANIIISERIMEELKVGKTVKSAIENGYKNGFSSVLDGNITTAIVAIILMLFGSGTMLSFGYTLLVGMVVNVIVGVNVSKKLLQSLLFYPSFENEKLYSKKKELKIFMFYQKKYVCAIISGVVFLIGVICIFINGVKLDTQFTGGIVMEYQISDTVDQNQIVSNIAAITDRAATIQETESRVDGTKSLEITLAGTGGMSPQMQKDITDAVVKAAGDSTTVTLSQTFSVEPYIGEKALKNSGIAIILSCIFIVLYVWFRFSSISGLSAGVMALVALLHDVLVCFFVFVIAGIPLNDAFVAVVLTIIGYSINDTIVVYDRIRENQKKNGNGDLIQLTNESISQVLARSLNTSITTAICVLSILVAAMMFGIKSIFDFSLPMFFGLISGCYSSVCIAAVLWAMWEKHKEKSVRKNGSKVQIVK